MKIKSWILSVFAIAALFLTSCGKHSNGQSVWSEGTWLLLVPFGALCVFFSWKTWKASTSGSIIPNPDPRGKPIYSDENIPFYKHAWFGYAIACLLLEIAIIWGVNADK